LSNGDGELEAAVDVEQLVAVLEAVEPAPLAAVEEEPAQVGGALVGVEAAGCDEAELAAGLQEGVGLLDEQLVAVEVGRALVAEGVLAVGVAGSACALGGPLLVQLAGLVGAAGTRETRGLPSSSSRSPKGSAAWRTKLPASLNEPMWSSHFARARGRRETARAGG
jgi:hypothetical protein